MREAIKILRQELAFCTQLAEQLEAMEKVLKEKSTGSGMSGVAKKLEQVLSEASRLDAKQGAFLKKEKQSSLQGFLMAQPASIEKDMALRLLEQVKAQQERLRKLSATNHLLLEKSKQFIDFHINVLSRTAASPTYGPPGTSGAGQRGRRMFDQNV